MFGASRPFAVSDIPESRLRDRLERLPSPARDRATAWLHEFDFPPEDINSLSVDDDGGVLYVCEFPSVNGEQETFSLSEPEVGEAAIPVSPFPESLHFSSRPGATNIIYLDFIGSNITGTAWNNSLGRSVIPTLAFSTDTDYTSFSDSEQAIIKRVWQRVAEDFAAFDVDVTTVRPFTMNNRVAHVLITRNTDANGDANPSSGAGGVAYVNVYGNSNFAYYRPAWVYHNNLSNSEANIAEAASHEAGHNLGLSHDGQTNGTEYYRGHGSGATSWAPIMGVGYGKAVTQWSRGEYYLANNTQDDLAIISGKLKYRDSDHASVFGSATYLTLTSNSLVKATNPETDPANGNTQNKGVIERNNDVDMWAFSSGSGQVNLTVRPWVSPASTRGGNLDVAISLFDSAGNLIATNNPVGDTFGTIQAAVTAGVYFLKIENAGFGNPTSSVPTG